jgi:hypothetical protein
MAQTQDFNAAYGSDILQIAEQYPCVGEDLDAG